MLYDLPALIRGQPYFSLRRNNAPVMFFWDNNFINIDHSLPENLRPFDYCKSAFYAYGEQQRLEGVNIIINSNNPLWVIDLDTSSAQNDQERAFNALVLERFRGKAYIENSKTAGNYHIIGCIDPVIKQQFIAAQPAGNQSGVRLSKHLELYVGTKAISLNAHDFESHGFDGMSHMVDAQAAWAEFTNLWGYAMGQKGKGPQEARPVIDLELPEEIFEDDDIIERARYASNGAEFEYLFDTPIYDGDADKSEKDQALMNFIAFYTKNREQALRIFRSSERGERDKVTKDDRYLNRTFDSALARLSDKEAESIAEDEAWNNIQLPMPTRNVPSVAPAEPEPAKEPKESIAKYMVDEKFLKAMDMDREAYVPTKTRLTRPPGPLGQLFDWLTESAPSPMIEAQTTSLLALLAGICGRSFVCITEKGPFGLSNYYILMANAGTGKSSSAQLVRSLMEDMNKINAGASDMIQKEKLKSGGAYLEMVNEFPTSLLIFEEFATMFADMNKTHDQLIQLREKLLEAWTSNMPKGVISGSKARRKENSQQGVTFPAVSLWAEGVPSGFLKKETLKLEAFQAGLYPRCIALQSTAEPQHFKEYRYNDEDAEPTPIPDQARTVLSALITKALKMDACISSPENRKDFEKGLTTIHLTAELQKQMLKYKKEFTGYMCHAMDYSDDYKTIVSGLLLRYEQQILKISGAVAVYNYQANDFAYSYSKGGGNPSRPKHTKESLKYAQSIMLRNAKVWRDAWLGDKIGTASEGVRWTQMKANEAITAAIHGFLSKKATYSYKCSATAKLKAIGVNNIISHLQIEWLVSRNAAVQNAAGHKVIDTALAKLKSLHAIKQVSGDAVIEQYKDYWGGMNTRIHRQKKFYMIDEEVIAQYVY